MTYKTIEGHPIEVGGHYVTRDGTEVVVVNTLDDWLYPVAYCTIGAEPEVEEVTDKGKYSQGGDCDLDLMRPKGYAAPVAKKSCKIGTMYRLILQSAKGTIYTQVCPTKEVAKEYIRAECRSGYRPLALLPASIPLSSMEYYEGEGLEGLTDLYN